jgi:hypothetical protein
LYQLDVKSAFLNGELKEEVYVEQPQWFIIQGEEENVYKLRKTLYGLKQTLRAWYNHIDNYFNESGFKRSKSEPTLYVKHQGNDDFPIVALYVDDLILTGSSTKMIEEFKKNMVNKYEMSVKALLHYFLGIEVYQDKEELFISQKDVCWNFFEKIQNVWLQINGYTSYCQWKIKERSEGKKVDASLYKFGWKLAISHSNKTWHYFAASLLSRFIHSPSHFHFAVAKRLLIYIQGTTSYGIRYCRKFIVKLIGFCDSNWGGCVDDTKSTSGYAFSLGSGVFS